MQPIQAETSGTSEFDNIWKQLQSSLPADSSSQGTSLTHAAAVLPRVPSPSLNIATGKDLNQSAKGFDVQGLFSRSPCEQDAKSKLTENESTSQPNSSKVVSNDEFAAMFKSLEQVQISKEEKEKESGVILLMF